jgi:beta-glucosidase
VVAGFPDHFLWGTATCAHQIEGGNIHSDWWEFEQQPGRIANGERSGAAADHWNRVDEDIELMTRLGANSYRMGIEWARLEPEDGGAGAPLWDEGAWDHYQREIDGLLAAGIQPMVTLLHFTLPVWLARRGGVCALDFPARFGRFAAEAARRLPDVRLWCTINEPNVVMFFGYVDGVFPPGAKDPKRAVQAFRGQLRGHAAAARALREVAPYAMVGVANHLAHLEPLRPRNPLDRIVTRQADKAFNWAFQDAIHEGRARLKAFGFPSLDEPIEGLKGSTDFFGLQYYTRTMLGVAMGTAGMVRREVAPGAVSDLGWEIYPPGFEQVIREAWARYRLPVIVTENGIADASGDLRPSYLSSHVAAMRRAMADGVPVLGYYHWSLLDNFEWAEGFGPRFGLYRVDYATQERHETPACAVFRELASGGSPTGS